MLAGMVWAAAVVIALGVGARTSPGAAVGAPPALVADAAAGTPAPERLLLDVDVTAAGVEPLPGGWRTAAMADADTLERSRIISLRDSLDDR